MWQIDRSKEEPETGSMDRVVKHSHNVLLTSPSSNSACLCVSVGRWRKASQTRITASEGQEMGCVYKNEASPVWALMVQMRLSERTGGCPWWECESAGLKASQPGDEDRAELSDSSSPPYELAACHIVAHH